MAQSKYGPVLKLLISRLLRGLPTQMSQRECQMCISPELVMVLMCSFRANCSLTVSFMSRGLHLVACGEHYSTGQSMILICIFLITIRAGEARRCVVSGFCCHGRVSAAHKCSVTGEGQRLLPQTQVHLAIIPTDLFLKY